MRLIRSIVAERMFGAREVLIAAKHLLQLPGVEIAGDVYGVTYCHFMFDRHEVLYANGTPSESLYPGPMALETLDPAALAEIREIFPALADETWPAMPDPPVPSSPAGQRGN